MSELSKTIAVIGLLAPIGATVLFQSVGIGSPLIIGGLLFVLCGVIAATPLVRRPVAAS